MKTKDVRRIIEEINSIPIKCIQDREFIIELTKLYTAIGDFFSLVRLPGNTAMDYVEYSKFNTRKRRYKLVKEQLKEEENV